MTDLLKTMRSAVTRQMIEGQGAHFIVRGLAVPLDPFGEGVVRTGKKVEYELPLIAPDNKFNLTEDAVYDTDRIELDRDPDWVAAGGYMTIGQRELHEVEDVSDTTVIFTSRLLADHQINTPVYHYSNPIVVEGSYSATQTTINVDVPSFLVRGDVIGISPSADLDISFVEYRITSLRYVGVGPNNFNQYQVVLHRGLHRAITDGEIIQLRAYPAYVSRILPIPQAANTELPVVGPFLLDWLSAPFLNNLEVDEYMTIQRYNAARLPIGSPQSVEKNHQILNVPIRADQLLWWTKVYGTVKYDNDQNRLVAIPDDDGYWRMHYRCVPTIDVPYTSALGLIVTVPTAQLQNNEGFRIPDDVDAVQFEYQVDGAYTKSSESEAAGQITATGIPTDNETFTLDDGFGTSVTFEFQATGGFVSADSTYRIVDVTTAVLATDVAIAMEQAVNVVAALQITAVNTGPVLDLTNDNISQLGNTTIVETSAALTISQQFIGGTDPVVTIDISSVTTALEVAQQTAAAVNRTDLHINAQYPTLANSVRLQSTVEGSDGNGAITETVSDSGFTVQGMSGGSGGTTWNVQIKPEQDILLRVRLYPNDFQDYNITGGTTQTIAVDFDPTDDPVERIELFIKGTPDTEILIGDWGIRGARVEAVQHTYIAHIMGERNYACSGLMAKPLFHSKEDLTINYDDGHYFDTGAVRL